MKEQSKVLLGRILILALITTGYFISRKSWWFLAHKNLFQEWYPSFGIFLWFFKSLILFTIICLSLYAAFQFLKDPIIKSLFVNVKRVVTNPNTIIILPFVVLSYFIGEEHPFTRTPMYGEMHKKNQVFSINNCEGQLVPLNKLSVLIGGELSHLYYSFESEENKEDLGSSIWNGLLIDSSKLIKGECYCLQKSFISEKIKCCEHSKTLYKYCVE